MENDFMPDDLPKLESALQSQAEELQQLYDLAPCGYLQAFHCRTSIEYFSKSVQSIGKTSDRSLS
jgi:hypothetical protein